MRGGPVPGAPPQERRTYPSCPSDGRARGLLAPRASTNLHAPLIEHVGGAESDPAEARPEDERQDSLRLKQSTCLGGRARILSASVAGGAYLLRENSVAPNARAADMVPPRGRCMSAQGYDSPGAGALLKCSSTLPKPPRCVPSGATHEALASRVAQIAREGLGFLLLRPTPTLACVTTTPRGRCIPVSPDREARPRTIGAECPRAACPT